MDALEKGEGRKDKRESDQGAIAILAARGIDSAERARLRTLIAEGLRAAPVESSPTLRAQQDAARNEALVALRGWYLEWSEVARASVSRRDHLILLGLAHRRAPVEEASDPSEATVEKPTEASSSATPSS